MLASARMQHARVAAMLVIAYVIYPITQRYRIETMHTITTSKELKEAST